MSQEVVKLGGYDFYDKVLKKCKYVVAPMVDQSELAWRILSRRYGAQLVYTPMIHARLFLKNEHIRAKFFDLVNGEEGNPALDRPLIVQFCANDPEELLAAAQIVQDHCDAVDINLGCPQDIAKKGHYGSFLQDEWDLIHRMINICHEKLKIPITAKFRVFPTIEKTVEYAKMLENAGAQILTCHGRLREQRGQYAGLADWNKIRAVKEAVKVPLFANGNLLYHSDIEQCLKFTGADGVMSAEGQLYNAALFAKTESEVEKEYDEGLQPLHADLALEYLNIVKDLKTNTQLSAVKGHMFKLMRPALMRETDLRDRLGRVCGKDSFNEYVEIATEMKVRMDRDVEASKGTPPSQLITTCPKTGLKVLPHWLAQPYFRPPPPPPTGKRAKAEAANSEPNKRAKLSTPALNQQIAV